MQTCAICHRVIKDGAARITLAGAGADGPSWVICSDVDAGCEAQLRETLSHQPRQVMIGPPGAEPAEEPFSRLVQGFEA